MISIGCLIVGLLVPLWPITLPLFWGIGAIIFIGSLFTRSARCPICNTPVGAAGSRSGPSVPPPLPIQEASTYYISIGGNVSGPFDKVKLREEMLHVDEGAEVFVARAGGQKWVTVAEMFPGEDAGSTGGR